MSASTHTTPFNQIDVRASDLGVVLASAVVLFFVRLVLGATVLKRAAEKLQLNAKKTRKFKEYAWYTLYYPAVFGFACYMCYKSGVNWVWGNYSDNLFNNFPQWSDETEFSWIRPYYLIQLGFYVQALFCLLFIDTKLSDFYELLLHHVVTIALIGLSLASRFHRCGITVFILHDCADILLYSAKAGHEIHKSISSVLFPLFVVAFAYTRMYKFPNAWYDMLTSPDRYANGFKTFYSRQGGFSLSPLDGSVGVCLGTACASYYIVLIMMLGMLILLNSYWFSLILRMAVRMTLLKKNEGDIRDKDHQKGQ